MSKGKRQSNRKLQGRNMTVMTYAPKHFVHNVLMNYSNVIRAFAFIYHDKFSESELGDKDKKEPHYHIVLRLTRPFTESAISKWFIYYNSDGLKQRVDVKITDDYVESFDYLTHKHSPEKYQFNDSDIVCSDLSKFKRLGYNPDDDNAINALDDLLSGKTIYDVCHKYGRDIIFHMPQLKYTFDLIYYGREIWELKDKGLMLDRTMQEINKLNNNGSIQDINEIFKGSI